MSDDSDEDFLRHWAERAYDQVQLAQIHEIERHIVAYAMEGWRHAGRVLPPVNEMLICACGGVELVLMSQISPGEWRTNTGQPHKPPDYWMPAPRLPKPNERGR